MPTATFQGSWFMGTPISPDRTTLDVSIPARQYFLEVRTWTLALLALLLVACSAAGLGGSPKVDPSTATPAIS